ncbi:MAG: putative glycoside hydrolase [Actinobacteria bacterium]|nr:putative glycoside hydrolase [Actinomycetota bacterium]
MRAQIKAVEEAGVKEWLLWDPSVKYTEGALRAG